MHKIVTLFIISFLTLSSLSAQTTSARPGINLSLWKGISTLRPDSTRTSILNVGIASKSGAVRGMAVNLLSSVAKKDVAGIGVVGICNVVGGDASGIQIAGITQVARQSVHGFTLSGLASVTGRDVQGISISGLTDIVGNKMQGISVGGLLNVVGREACGVQMGGVASIAGGSIQGVEVSGLMNVTGQVCRGVQAASLLNVTGGYLQGLQLALVNVTVRGKGLQLGVFNYYHEQFEGVQLGLVNANRSTRYQWMAFGGNQTKMNVGVRVMNRRLYTIVGAGAPYLDFSDRFTGSLFYRAGVHYRIGSRFSLSGDLGYQHIELFKNHSLGLPHRLYSLQSRLNLEYRLGSRYGLFTTSGYGYDRYYGKNANFDHGMIVEAGIVLL